MSLVPASVRIEYECGGDEAYEALLDHLLICVGREKESHVYVARINAFPEVIECNANLPDLEPSHTVVTAIYNHEDSH